MTGGRDNVVWTDDEDEVHETLDDAIAAAFAMAADGDEVAVHAVNCVSGLIDEHGEYRPCSCDPVVHVVHRGTS